MITYLFTNDNIKQETRDGIIMLIFGALGFIMSWHIASYLRESIDALYVTFLFILFWIIIELVLFFVDTYLGKFLLCIEAKHENFQLMRILVIFLIIALSVKLYYFHNDLFESSNDPEAKNYIINQNTGVFHKTNCPYIDQMDSENIWNVLNTRENIKDKGYKPCEYCMP